MFDIKGTTLGEFDFSTRPLEKDEKKFYGIFISHSSLDNKKYLEPLCEKMIENGLDPLYDQGFLEAGDDYQSIIEESLDCYAAIVIVTQSSLESKWANYEMGMLTAKGIPVFLFDPEGCFARTPLEEYHDVYLSRLDKIFNDMDLLVEALVDSSPYSEMFTEEIPFIDCKTFKKRMRERVETVVARIESKAFEEIYDELLTCKLGVLVPNFGLFYQNYVDGEHCYARRHALLENGVCPHSKASCALAASRTLEEDNKECVLLNHILYTGRVLKKGETDHLGRSSDTVSLLFHMPLHKLYGTEFKFIIDVPENQRSDTIFKALQVAGMNPDGSMSINGGRIYISLYERRGQGLFRLNEFTNNFLCPHATHHGRE
ncbi:MAG: toll/interleukin-1 receptor domain-containing protein [Clostridia bacterium]|nr:toll/interleukin-1 receptor domain-containing protein [Clostridia bacterium]